MEPRLARLVAAHLDALDEVERRGIALLDRGANPARAMADVYAIVYRLQLEQRFQEVDLGLLQSCLAQIANAQEDDANQSSK